MMYACYGPVRRVYMGNELRVLGNVGLVVLYDEDKPISCS